jgi:hypothetical protein
MKRTTSLHLLVTLPLLVLPAVALVASPARAASSPALEAVGILAKARASDEKCKFLSAKERAELARYAARAELASASQSSAAATRAAVAAGSAEGRDEPCGEASKTDVGDTLFAAREAMAEAVGPAPRNAVPESRRVLREPAGDRMAPRDAGGLRFYARVVSAYYLERECKSLGRDRDDHFWRRIAVIHRDTVSRFGRRAVAPLKERAEAGAQGTSCGNRVRDRIVQAYEDVSSR